MSNRSRKQTNTLFANAFHALIRQRKLIANNTHTHTDKPKNSNQENNYYLVAQKLLLRIKMNHECDRAAPSRHPLRRVAPGQWEKRPDVPRKKLLHRQAARASTTGTWFRREVYVRLEPDKRRNAVRAIGATCDTARAAPDPRAAPRATGSAAGGRPRAGCGYGWRKSPAV